MDNLDKKMISQEPEIDLVKLAKKLWRKRMFIFKVCSVGLFLGVIVAFSLPREYTTTVILAPEVNSAQRGGLGALAAMAGISLQQSADQDFPTDLYPDVVKSTPFLVGLFDVQVKDTQREIETSLYSYLEEEQKKVWWSYIISAPFKLLNLFFSKEEGIVQEANTNSRTIKITEKQDIILKNLQGRIEVYVSDKTGVITLSSRMQSPIISAFIADTITSYMQEYIIGYRTQKARRDLAFTEQLYNESQNNYYESQRILSTYIDENLGIVSARYRNTLERLQSETNLNYGVYTQMAQQLQMAKIKVQDTTPVYTIIQPAVVPLRAASPKKMQILIVFIFFAFIGSCGWTLAKDSILGQWKK